MKIYGVGVLYSPGSKRIVHDFEDGPFETFNPVLIAEAKKRGFSVGKPLETPVVKAKRKYVRKAKNERT